MDTPAKRLIKARERKYPNATEASKALFGRYKSTYACHENGSRGFASSAKRYANFFGVDYSWLMTGRGDMTGGNPMLEKIESLPAEAQGLVAEFIDLLESRHKSASQPAATPPGPAPSSPKPAPQSLKSSKLKRWPWPGPNQ